MKTQSAIDHYGSATKVAEILGISKAAVSQWGENVPELRALQLEIKSEGALKAKPITSNDEAKGEAA